MDKVDNVLQGVCCKFQEEKFVTVSRFSQISLVVKAIQSITACTMHTGFGKFGC